MKRALLTSAFAGTAVLGGVAACDDSTAPGSQRVSMALSVPAAASFASSDVAVLTSNDDPVIIVRGRQRLRLDRVELTLARVDLRGVGGVSDRDTDLDTDTDHDTDTDSDTDRDGFDNFRFRGPVTVALPLRGGVIAPIATVVPFGTYDRVRFWIESARLVGAFDDDLDGSFEPGETFNVTVPVRQAFTLRISPPLVVDAANAANLTIALSPPEWFRNADRSLFNPRRLQNDHQLRARFRHLVRTTLRAFRDGNRNGDDRDTDH